jgi:hypothetical protein
MARGSFGVRWLSRSPECFDGPVFDLDPGFELVRERFRFLVWGEILRPARWSRVWWHARKLPGGSPAYVSAAQRISWTGTAACTSSTADRLTRPRW